MERTTATNTHLAGDAALVERARAGDREAFTALVDARLSTTYRTASAFLGSEPDAREVTEEIFVRAWRDLPELPAPDGFGAWFTAIVDDACRRAALDRRRGKVRDISAGPADLAGVDRPTTSGTLRGQILERVATTKQRSGARPVATALARPDRVSMSRRKRLGIGIPAIVLLSVALVAIVGQRLQGPQTPFRTGLLAFVRDGDVYIANPDGSAPARVVHQDGVALSSVAWSPDGRRVAIDGDSGAIVYDSTTGATTYVGGNGPVWSPDGRQIAVIQAGVDDTKLRVVTVDSGTSTTYPFNAISDLAWSPDGRWITAAGSEGGNSGGRFTTLIRLELATGQISVIDPATRVRGATRQPSWSPDSFRIAFARGATTSFRCGGTSLCESDVYTADPDGTGLVQLNDPDTNADQPAWSPDGAWVAFRQAPRTSGTSADNTTDPDAGVGLVVVSPDLTASRTIAARGVQAFAWSPEGDRLRYVRSEGQGRPSTLWEVAFGEEATIEGKTPVAKALSLTVDPAVPFYYGRSGAGVAWQSLARAVAMPSVPSAKPAPPAAVTAVATPAGGSPADPSATWPSLAIESNDGCAPPTLIATKDASVTQVGKGCDPSNADLQYSWSPSGTRHATLDGSGQLSITDLDGTVHENIGGLSGLSTFSWSAGGSWLSITGFGDRIIRPDGTGLADVPGTPTWSADDRRMWISKPSGALLVGNGDGTDMTDIGNFPPYVAWSPDGSRFAFVKDGDVWTAAADGTDARNVTAFPLGGASNMTWSPDGTWLAVTTSHGAWLMRPDRSDRPGLVFGPTTSVGGVTWAPDTSRLAVETYQETPTGASIATYLLTVDGSSATRLDGLTGATWSPDGRFLAGSHANPSQGGGYEIGNLELMNADGSGRHELPVSTNGNWPIWVNRDH